MRVLISLILVSLVLCGRFAWAGEAVLGVDTVNTVDGYREQGDRVDVVTVKDDTVSFPQALRVTRAKAGGEDYAAVVSWVTKAAVRKGDLLVATLYLRNLEPEKGALNVGVTFQLKDAPYTPTLISSTPVDKKSWVKYAIPFRAIQDYPAGGSTLQLRYALKAQRFEVGGVGVENLGVVADPIPAAIADQFAYYYPGRGDAAAPWRKAALQRIKSIRRGDMRLRVVDGQGKPVAGAEITLAQTASPFVWSTVTSATALVCNIKTDCPTEGQVGTATLTSEDYVRFRQELLKNFNAVSFENDLKWTDWHPNQQLALDGLAWLKRNHMPVSRGHTLIWPSFGPEPLMPVDVINRDMALEKIERVIEQHFAQQLGVLRGQIPQWDVVNEPFTNTDVQGRLATPNVEAVKGVLPISVVAKWFKSARKHDPKALLFLNEFGILDNINTAKQKNTLALLKDIQKRGGPVDGIGFQGHFGASGPVIDDMQRVVDDFTPHVKTMSLTEFDFETLDPKLQADLTEDVMTFIYSQPKFSLFQMWGFWDGSHWLGSAPLFTRDWRLKPSGEVWQRLTQQTWRTNVSGKTDAKGSMDVKAFFGTYTVRTTINGKQCEDMFRFEKAGEQVVKPNC